MWQAFPLLLLAVVATAPAADPVQRLQAKIESGEARLEFHPRYGWLPSVLEALEIPVSSQSLVFSKTSAQARLISPRSPRALYFNDDVYVGWVRGGPILEVSAADPAGGGVFYTLDQDPGRKPRFQRDSGQCLQCHESGRTQGIPGHLTRSLPTDSSGLPHFGAGSIDVDDTTAFAERFGGWYVTGTHPNMTHRGNVTTEDPSGEIEPRSLTRLDGLFDVESYLRPDSDVVAQLVLAHQTQMHNAIALANLNARSALDYREEMYRVFGERSESVEASVDRRLRRAADTVVRYLLFADQTTFQGPIRGTSPFAKEFQARGKRDARGRSLRDLDLETRLFRYPCSFLIHSEAFQSLPDEVLALVFQRLDAILAGQEAAPFARLTDEDRRAIREILDATLER